MKILSIFLILLTTSFVNPKYNYYLGSCYVTCKKIDYVIARIIRSYTIEEADSKFRYFISKYPLLDHGKIIESSYGLQPVIDSLIIK